MAKRRAARGSRPSPELSPVDRRQKSPCPRGSAQQQLARLEPPGFGLMRIFRQERRRDRSSSNRPRTPKRPFSPHGRGSRRASPGREATEDRAILDLAQQVEHRHAISCGAPESAARRWMRLDRLAIASAWRPDGSRSRRRRSRSASSISERASSAATDAGLTPAHGFVECGQERPPRLGRGAEASSRAQAESPLTGSSAARTGEPNGQESPTGTFPTAMIRVR